MDNDPYCFERPSADPTDSCCVLVVCSTVDEPDEYVYDDDEGEQEKDIATEKVEQATTTSTTTTTAAANEQAENVSFLQISPTTIQVQFPGITGGNLMHIEERLFRKSSATSNWENAIILEGNKIFTLTNLRPGTEYRLRWRSPDRQFEDVLVSTAVIDEKKPKIISTGHTFDSVTVSFDHFAPEGYDHGYVAMFKPAEGGNWQTHDDEEEKKKALLSTAELHTAADDLPSITIGNLRPSTSYMVRVAIYDDYSTRSLGTSTGIIDVRTDSKTWLINFHSL